MPFEHPTGVPAAYDRAPEKPSWSGVIVREDRFAQGAEINEMSSIERRRNRRIGNLVAKDGDRIDGCEIEVSEVLDEGEPLTIRKMNISLLSGRVYVAGDVLPVSGATFANIDLIGETTVGVRLVRSAITEADDPDLLGLHPGSEAEGEPGAAREVSTISWALSGDDGEGEFFSVYLILDGAVIDQSPPPSLTGINRQIAAYDFDYGGNYIVDGCQVRALGLDDGSQLFSIAAGTANIVGWKRIREAALRFSEPEEPTLETVSAEPHTFTGTTGGTTIVTVNRPPISAVTSAIIAKRVTETIVRGGSAGGNDPLGNSSVIAIETITQGVTTFVAGTDYTLSGDEVSWAPGGAEPAGGSSYSVTYRYNDSVTPDSVTATTVTLTGVVNGSTILLSYTSKVPRKDILCLDITGRPVYVKGISARTGALAPLPPSNLLKLATIENDWFGTPIVVNDGTRNYTADDQRRLFTLMLTIVEQFQRQRLEAQITAFEPVAKRGIFTDSFIDDFYRDQGEAQTAAINQGVLQLAVDAIQIEISNAPAALLPWVEEIVVRQDLATSEIRINPYQAFRRMPAGMTLTPNVDFWTAEASEWTSPITREFTAAPGQPPEQTTINEVTQIRREAARILRQIQVALLLEGFGVGENLAELTFSGIDVKPPGTQTGDSNGEIALTFTIPPNVPVGRHVVRARGAVDSFAEATFAGEGTIDITTMRRVTLVSRAAPDPVVVINTTTVIQQNIIQQISQPFISVPDVPEGSTGGEGQRGGGDDPLAQTFTLPEPRHVIGINFRVTEVGDPTNGIRVQLATVENGFPTRDVLAEAFISMVGVDAGDLIEARFRLPVFCRADREYCFVILTSDADHSVAIAKLGDIDVPNQVRVSSQPYLVGVLLTSANRLTWTAFQEADLFFQIVCARFTSNTRTVDLLTTTLDEISDVLVRGSIELPTDATTFRYELVRDGGQVIALAPGQTLEFSEYLDEDVTLRAVLGGTPTLSPILYPFSQLIGGRIRPTGTYVTRAFTMGTAIKVAALFAARLPAGSDVTVEVDAADDDWAALDPAGSVSLGGGWNEPRFEIDPHTASVGRVRITLEGTPAARPSIAQLRAYSV